MKKSTGWLFIIFLFLSTGCTRNISQLNNNGKSSTTAPSVSVFLAGEKNLVDQVTTPVNPFRVIAQSWTENTYTYNARYVFSVDDPMTSWWNAIYENVINNLQHAKLLYSSDIEDSTVKRNDADITDILEVYSYHLLINTFGDVPYSQANNSAIPFPKYDDADTIYKNLILRLDTASAGLNTASTSLGASDQIYEGDVSKWKKFANTLKLKLGLLYADKDLSYATSIVKQAVDSGVFTSNSDNALLTYDNSTTTNSNPIWQNLVNSGRHDYSPTDLIIDTLKAWNDPRLSLYFTTDAYGDYSGGIPGNGNSYVTLSKFSSLWLGAEYPGDLLDYPETEFLLSEAAARGIDVGGDAATYYNNAVTASILFWGGTETEAAAYLAQSKVAYSTANGTWRQKIGWQKWIAFANRNFDTWLEVRRLGYPNIDVINPPQGANGNLPLRFYYPSAEQSSNPTNWAAAVAKISGGQDVVSAKLFWMP